MGYLAFWALCMEHVYFRIFGDYAARGPVFYTRAECPWLAEIERHWMTIREEFEAYYYRNRRSLTPSYVPDAVEVRIAEHQLRHVPPLVPHQLCAFPENCRTDRLDSRT